MLASDPESAEAKQKGSSCAKRHADCVGRCIERYNKKPGEPGPDKSMECISRTCDHQQKQCENAQTPNAPRPGGVKETGGVGNDPKGTRPTSPPKGGTWHGAGSSGSGPLLKSGGKR